MPKRELTPGRYALDRNGRLYSCRGPWRRNAVAIVTIRRRDARIADLERGKIAAIEALLVPPTPADEIEPDDDGGGNDERPQFKLGFSSAPGSMKARSIARFKPMGLRSEDDDAAAAYARAAEVSSRD